MKLIHLTFSILFILFVFNQKTNAQNLDSLQNQVMKLKKYYDSYDDGSSEASKKAKYNDAINEISGGTASEKDKADAYKIIDWYIKGDKAIGTDTKKPEPKGQDFDEMIQNSDEVKQALQLMEQQKNIFMNMSYPEFEKTILTANPVAGKKEMKQAYNELHKNDGKQVTITKADDEMTETQKQVWAFGVFENPKNYEEFSKAFKTLDPKMLDSDIRKAWEQNKNK